MEWKLTWGWDGIGLEMEWKWNEDGNRQKICYRIEEKWNRNEIKSRVRFHAEENEAEIKGKLVFRLNWKIHETENKKCTIRLSILKNCP